MLFRSSLLWQWLPTVSIPRPSQLSTGELSVRVGSHSCLCDWLGLHRSECLTLRSLGVDAWFWKRGAIKRRNRRIHLALYTCRGSTEKGVSLLGDPQNGYRLSFCFPFKTTNKAVPIPKRSGVPGVQGALPAGVYKAPGKRDGPVALRTKEVEGHLSHLLKPR